METNTRRAIEVRPAARQITPTVQTRSADGLQAPSQYEINGYAAVFNVVTELFRWGDEVYEEVISAGAFAKSLARGDDVACVIEHDWGRVVARRSGGTLDLAEDSTGLKVRAVLAKTTKSADLVADIEHGNIKGMSFRFFPVSDREECFDRPETAADGTVRKVRVCKRTIMEADISDVSPCVWPAYPTTTLGLGESGGESGGDQMDSQRSMHTHKALSEAPEWVRRSVNKRMLELKQSKLSELRKRLEVATIAQRLDAAKQSQRTVL